MYRGICVTKARFRIYDSDDSGRFWGWPGMDAKELRLGCTDVSAQALYF